MKKLTQLTRDILIASMRNNRVASDAFSHEIKKARNVALQILYECSDIKENEPAKENEG